MQKTVKHYCDNCAVEIYKGFAIRYKYPISADEYSEDEIGDYHDKSGICLHCGMELCESCGGFKRGVCKDCQEG